MTDSAGRRPADSRPASLSRWSAMVRLTLIALAVITLVAIVHPEYNHEPQESTPSYARLVHKQGIYSFGSEDSVRHARSSGNQLVVTPAAATTESLLARLAAENIDVIDSRIARLTYRILCPTGTDSCREPSDGNKANLVTDIRRHVQQMRDRGGVAAFYLLDDYRPGLDKLLPDVYAAIRSGDPKTPTVCGLALTLSTQPTAGSSFVTSYATFDRALKNYSPKWCDSVMLYSYGPALSQPSTRTVDWAMHTTLPYALRQLRRHGWDSQTQPLIGTPQAFGYFPRTSVRGVAVVPKYRQAPSTSQLRQQVASFCKSGAQSIVAYTWDDGSGGTINELSNDPALRRGLSQGVSDCRANYWH